LFKVLAGGDKIRKSSLGGVKTAAEMINLMGTAIEGTVIESIRNHDADLAQKIMDKMFVFDDVLKLDDKAIQMVLKEVSSDVLIVALKGANPSSKKKFSQICRPGQRRLCAKTWNPGAQCACPKWKRSRRRCSRPCAVWRTRGRS
jgi:flagellar motor switch protein FliG